MNIGVSTACFYPMLLEDSLAKVCGFGISCTEVFLNTFSELETGYLKDLRRAADGGGVSISSLHPFTSSFEPFLFFTGYDRRYRDGLEMYKRYFDAANLLGASFLVFHGDRKEGHLEDREYFERYAKLYELGKAQGVTVSQENVARCRSGNVEFIKSMRQYLKDGVNFVFDIKQAVRAGFSPFEMLKAMGSQITHTHVSDHTSDFDCLPPGQGGFDFKGFFKEIKNAEANFSVIIELYRSNYNEPVELQASVEYLKRISAD